MPRTLGVFTSLFLLVASTLSSADEFKCFPYEPGVVELSGKIMREAVYGPPGFGDDPALDVKENIYILNLDEPISVMADKTNPINADSFQGIQMIQLSGQEVTALASHVGRQVTIKGTLFERHTAEHRTDVLMSVISVMLVTK